MTHSVPTRRSADLVDEIHEEALVGGLVSFRVPVKNDIEYQGQSERVVGLRRLGEAEPPDVLSGQRGGVQQLLVQVGDQLGRAPHEQAARKSVAYGKSVSAWLELGGRRIINNKIEIPSH